MFYVTSQFLCIYAYCEFDDSDVFQTSWDWKLWNAPKTPIWSTPQIYWLQVIVSWMSMKGSSSKGSVVQKQKWGEVHHFVRHMIVKWTLLGSGIVCRWLHSGYICVLLCCKRSKHSFCLTTQLRHSLHFFPGCSSVKSWCSLFPPVG